MSFAEAMNGNVAQYEKIEISNLNVDEMYKVIAVNPIDILNGQNRIGLRIYLEHGYYLNLAGEYDAEEAELLF